jgi:hypothetical protein
MSKKIFPQYVLSHHVCDTCVPINCGDLEEITNAIVNKLKPLVAKNRF